MSSSGIDSLIEMFNMKENGYFSAPELYFSNNCPSIQFLRLRPEGYFFCYSYIGVHKVIYSQQ